MHFALLLENGEIQTCWSDFNMHIDVLNGVMVLRCKCRFLPNLIIFWGIWTILEISVFFLFFFLSFFYFFYFLKFFFKAKSRDFLLPSYGFYFGLLKLEWVDRNQSSTFTSSYNFFWRLNSEITMIISKFFGWCRPIEKTNNKENKYKKFWKRRIRNTKKRHVFESGCRESRFAEIYLTADVPADAIS